MITDSQALANAVVSGQADVATILDPTTIELVQDRQETVSVGGTIVGFPVGGTRPESRTRCSPVEQAAARAPLRPHRPRGDRGRSAPRCPTNLAAVPGGHHGFDPALDEEYGYDPDRARELLAEAGYPDGFELNITVLGQPDEDLVAIQGQWAEVGVTLNFVSGDLDRPALRGREHRPVALGPVRGRRATRPASSPVSVYGGFMNISGAKEPEIEGALGAALGATGEAQEQALSDLNGAIAATVGTSRSTRTSPMPATTPTR